MLHLRCVLSDWAENFFGSSLGQDKALTQFSAQTDKTRLRIGPRKTPFWASKGTTCEFWPFFKRPPKRHFWALLGALVCLIFLFTFFWAKPIYERLSGVLIFVHFEKFVKWPQNRAKNDWYLLREKSPQKCRFGSKKLKFQTNCSKDTEIVKMSWIRYQCEIFRFWSKNRHFLATFRFLSIFQDFLKKSILAILPMLQLRRALSVWAEFFLGVL